MEELVVKINVSTLSDEHLECLLADVKNEQERHKNAQKREAWQKVMDAISEYIDNFGDIFVNDEEFRHITLDKYYTTSENYHTYGRLMPDYSEEDDDDEDE